MRFPLPPEQLPELRVDSQTLLQWQLDAQHSIQEVLLNRQSWYHQFARVKMQFKQVYNKHGVQGFSRKATNTGGPATIETLCQAELQLALDDIAYGIYCEDTAGHRVAMTQLHQEFCLDAAILHVSELGTAADPCRFSGVKWLAFTSPAKQIVALRDYIYYEHTCTTEDADGRSVVVSFIKSYPLRSDQVADHQLQTTRGNTYLFSIYRQEGEGVVMHNQGRNDAAGRMPAWFALAAVSSMFEGVLNLYALADARAIFECGLLNHKHLKPRYSTAAKCCRVCYKRFTLMRVRRSCRTCDHAVCRHCLVEIRVSDIHSTSSSGLPTVRERFCLRCLLFARYQRCKRQSSSELTRPTIQSEISCDSLFGDSGARQRMSRAQSLQISINEVTASASVVLTPVELASPRALSERSNSVASFTSIAESDEDRSEQFTSLYGRIAEQATILRRLRYEQQWRQSRAWSSPHPH